MRHRYAKHELDQAEHGLPIMVASKQTPATVRTVVPVGEERSRQFELRMILADSVFNVGTIPTRDASLKPKPRPDA